MNSLPISLVNDYVARKQHLLPTSHSRDVVKVVRDIVALHATSAAGPYLSLWARIPEFQRQMLYDALYERRELVRVLCMRTTLHVVPSDKLPYFHQADAQRRRLAEQRDAESLLVLAGVCKQGQAKTALQNLRRRVLAVLTKRGPSTVQEIGRAVPELEAKIRYSVGKAYEGEFSLGSRLVPGMCALGLLVRTRPRGSPSAWRSHLYEYAALADWLSDVNLDSVTSLQARTWLVRQYLSAFGPATMDDIQWWAGLSRSETNTALRALESGLVTVAIEGLAGEHLMLADDARRLRRFVPPKALYVFFLPALDPYIMGFQDRQRFLAPEHRNKAFDRAGNAMPTVWVNGQVVGAWGQRKDGSVVYGLFESVSDGALMMLAHEARRLESFLEGEFLALSTSTPFTRNLK
jgi:hypothetical protein